MKNTTTNLSFDELEREMEVLDRASVKSILGGKYPPKDPPIDTSATYGGTLGGGGGGYTSDGKNSGFTSGYTLVGFTGAGNTPSMDHSSSSNPNGNSSNPPGNISNLNSSYLVDGNTYTSASGNPYNRVSFDGGNTWVNEQIISQDTMPTWQAALNVISAGGEVIIGVIAAPESGGLSVFLIMDGLVRLGINTGNLIDPGAIGTSNIGGLIGRGLGGENGKKLGELINDGITAGVGGGALASGIEANTALQNGQHAKSLYFMIDGANSTINAVNTGNSSGN